MLRPKIVDLLRLPPDRRAGIAATVHPIIQQVSPCETLEDLVADFNAPCRAMGLATWFDGDTAAGYARYKISRLRLPGPCDVLRFDVTVRREYYGRVPFSRYFLRELFLRRELLGTTPFYGLFFCASPAAYYLLARTCPGIHPRPGPGDAGKDELLGRLAEAAGHPLAAGRRYSVGLWDRGFTESAAEREGWRRHPSPLVKFYLDHCPDYARGEALAIFVRITPALLLRTAARHLLDLARRRLGLTRSFRSAVLAGPPAPGPEAAPRRSAPEVARRPSG